MEMVLSLIINWNCVPYISTFVKYVKEYQMNGRYFWSTTVHKERWLKYFILNFICIFFSSQFHCTLYSAFMRVLLIFSRYSLENEDVIHDRNLLYTVARVILMIDPIEVIHYVNFVISVIWTMMNYSDIYGVTICSVISVMLMVSISIIGNVYFCLQVYSSLKNFLSHENKLF